MRHKTFRNSSQTAKEFQLTNQITARETPLGGSMRLVTGLDSRRACLRSCLCKAFSRKDAIAWKLVCLLPLSLYQLATSYIKVLRPENIFRLSSVVETLDLHCPGIVVSQEGEQDTGNTVKSILQHPLLNTKRKTSHANSDKPSCRLAPSRSRCNRPLARYNLIGRNSTVPVLAGISKLSSSVSWLMTLDLPDVMDA